MSSEIICAICEKPIESQKQLVVERLSLSEFETVHFGCRASRSTQSGEHWHSLVDNAANSPQDRSNAFVVTPLLLIAFLLSYFLVESRELSAFLGAFFVISLFYFFNYLRVHFGYERKLPK